MSSTSIQFPLTLYYDASCRFCNAEMTNLMLRNTQNRLRFVNCADPGFSGGPAPREALMRAIHGVDARGQVFIGVDCLTRAYEGIGWAWVHQLFSLPVVQPLAQRLYPVIARNRYRMPQWPVAWFLSLGRSRDKKRPLGGQRTMRSREAWGHLFLEFAARRAAERVARRSERCAEGRCEIGGHDDSH